MSKPIYILLGNKKKLIVSLLKKGNERTLLINTAPEKGEGLLSEIDPGYKLKNQMIADLVSFKYDQYLIDRENITDDDFAAYNYVTKNQGATLKTLQLTLDSLVDYTATSNRNVIVVEGDGLIELTEQMVKGANKAVVISEESILKYSELMEQKEGMPIKPTAQDLHDMYLMHSLNDKTVDLIVVYNSLIDGLDYRNIYQRFCNSYHCNLFKMQTLSDEKQIRKAVKDSIANKTRFEQSDSTKTDATSFTEKLSDWFTDFPNKPFWKRRREGLKESWRDF